MDCVNDPFIIQEHSNSHEFEHSLLFPRVDTSSILSWINKIQYSFDFHNTKTDFMHYYTIYFIESSMDCIIWIEFSLDVC